MALDTDERRGKLRMGRPGGSDVPSPANESIVCEEGTRGTETSKYPEEKKVRTIP